MKKGTISVLSTIVGAAAGTAAGHLISGKGHTAQEVNKYAAILRMFNTWLALKQEGRSIAPYFEKNHYERIGVYGMGYAGDRLLEELRGSGTEVVYGVDRNADRIFAEIDLITKDEIKRQPEVDAVIVTPIYTFKEIKKELEQVVNCPIISLEEIVYESIE